jgi:copper chaperone
MENLRFKTSLKCNGCVNAITPGMQSISSIESWKVDLENPDKLLEIEASSDVTEEVLTAVKKAGYQISRL